MRKKKFVILGILFCMVVCLSAARLQADGTCSDTTAESTDATKEEILSEFDPSQQILLDDNFYKGDVPSQIDPELLQEKGLGVIGDLPDTFSNAKKPPMLDEDGKPSKYSDEDGDWYWGTDGHLYPWPPPGPQPEVTRHPDGRTTTKYPDGRVVYDNPSLGRTTTTYPNSDGDYYPAPGSRTTIQYTDGRTVTIYPDGRRTTQQRGEGKTKTEHPDGRLETRYSDGTIQTDYPGGRLVTQYPEGKIVTRYPDGKVEIKYPDGRVEIKDETAPIKIHHGADLDIKLDLSKQPTQPETKDGTASEVDSVVDDLQPSVLSEKSPQDIADEAYDKWQEKAEIARKEASYARILRDAAEYATIELEVAMDNAMDAEPGEEAKKAAEKVKKAAKEAQETAERAEKQIQKYEEAKEESDKAYQEYGEALDEEFKAEKAAEEEAEKQNKAAREAAKKAYEATGHGKSNKK